MMDPTLFEADQLVDVFGRMKLKFDVYCDLLRKNDPRITEVRSCDYKNPQNGKQRYHRIGKALQGNTHITGIEMNLGELYTLKGGELDEDKYMCYDYLESEQVEDLVGEGKKSAGPILDYIRTCSSLRKLRLSFLGCEDWNLVNGRLAGHFYEAVLANPHPALEELRVDRWEYIDIPKEEFIRLLATQPLKRLTIRTGLAMTRDHFREPSTFTVPWLHAALNACPNLEYLALLKTDMRGGLELDGVYNGVISSLASHPALQELRVRIDDGTSSDVPAESLAKLLSSTGSLQTLELEGCTFFTEAMENFVTGLQSNSTLTRLVLLGEFRSQTNVFSEYLGSRRSQPSSLRVLSYNGKAHLLADAMVLEPRNDAKLLPYSVGSGLRTLTLGHRYHENQVAQDVARFFDSYAASASMIHLESLSIEWLHMVSCKAFSDCLPNMVHLRELSVSFIEMEAKEVADRMVESIKKNGSLHSVTIPSEYWSGDWRKKRQFVRGQRSMKWFCERNRSIPRLLAEPKQDTEGESPGNDNAVDGWLFPTLFYAAQQANRTAPNMMLIGLRTLSGSAGPIQNMKRLQW
jgi:hypothetical protein